MKDINYYLTAEPSMKQGISGNKGFTLVEMVIVMAVFVIVIMITGDAFRTILQQSMKLMRSEESNIEGVVGLEIFRHDLEQAGFGIPYSFPATVPTYAEAANAPANVLNDAPSGVPRAVLGRDNLASVADSNGTYTTGSGTSAASTYNTLAGSDYLAIKASTVGTSDTAQRWTYVTYSSATYGSKPPKVWATENLKSGDKVIAIRRTFTPSGIDSQLAFDPLHPDIYWVGFSNSGFVPAFSPNSPQEIMYLYGITSTATLGMPFNRADFFVANPATASSKPAFCAPNTGMLYKATVNHSNGKLNYIPLMDCVADMQVVLGWDMADNSGAIVTDPTQTGDGIVDTWSNADGSSASGAATNTQVQAAIADASHIRTKLKVIKVYILAQNGRIDRGYTSPAFFALFNALEGGSAVGKTYTLPLDGTMSNYRWKVYRLVVRPRNLYSNQ